MTTSSAPSAGLLLIVCGWFAITGCSMGTNTGNGANSGTGGAASFGSGGIPGFVVGSGGTPSCPIIPCSEPVSVNGLEGTAYRGSVSTDTQLLSWDVASDTATQPMMGLVFSGWKVEYTDLGCVYDSQLTAKSEVYICITSSDSWVDGVGVLHVHQAPHAVSCIGPKGSMDWGVDLSLSAEGKLAATLLNTSSPTDTDAALQEVTLSGTIEGSFYSGPGGEIQPVSISVGDGGTFIFPTTSPSRGCGGAT
jgi:hypothetical protein